MVPSKKHLQQLQADLAAANATIRRLQHENASLKNQLSSKPATTDTPPYPSECTTSSTVPSSPRNHLTPSKRPPSPNTAPPPPPKVSKPKHDISQPSLAAVARQFSSPSEPAAFKFIHVPVRRRLPMQQMRANLRKLHINTRRILDIQYPDRNVASFLIHIDYETELRSQLSKLKISVRDDFDPLDPSTIRDPDLINETIDRKIQHARHFFFSRLCSSLQRFKTPLYNTVANFFVQSGLIDLDFLASYDLAPPYKYRTGYILDHV
jgi:hypothetical protein